MNRYWLRFLFLSLPVTHDGDQPMSLPLNLDQTLQQIELSCRHKANHLLSGHYHSVYKGQGIEFDEVRQYASGDDVRHIDWNVTARTGDLYIKRFHEERELNVLFVVDKSASFCWSTLMPSRMAVATQICALIGHAALGNNDRIGLLEFSDEIDSYWPPARGRSQLMRCLSQILAPSAEPKGTRIQQALEQLNQLRLKRSIIVILSDFFEMTPQSSSWEALAILAQHHDVLACALDDPAELEMNAKGLMQFQDCEQDRIQRIDGNTPGIQSLFKQQSAERLSEQGDLFASHGVDLIRHRLGTDPAETLLAYFQLRRLRSQNETGGR